MRMYSNRFCLAIILFAMGTLVFSAGTQEFPAASVEEKPTVVVSILPQRYFIERIGGDLVNLLVLVGEGQSPHTYEPTPSQMSRLASADIWFLSGTDFEIALESKIRSLYPNLSIVDGTAGVAFRLMEAHGHHEEDDNHGHGHDQTENIDRHTWLGKQPALIMAGHIAEQLALELPAKRAVIEARHQELIIEIEAVFSQLSAQLSPLHGRTIFVYHPAFGYFFDEFGIIQEAVETGGKEPTAKVLTELIENARQENVAAIFVQKQFPVNAARTVANAVGAEVVALDPLDPDWIENVKNIGKALLDSTH
ncbi:MAG: metal ABC transporter substrate-binding protein [Spirochaetae bacterium HGW-Spirochaetae-2]|nr:MAG: metal ABC transporter substrate-binding protein [Spirochaetae bacterium HGW-Spirochaetae-2]